ncbi:hypothetical protein J2S40_001040 [Nocardioides luteus]|uniref:DUF4126 domain-containing protein n=1 Tax=Nocardioides luteus TaxID=1844 RepID=A0ABQ5SUF4_9ACTN|nr:DUF4126 domain-containing protein [Nocardioides luteus]MDR7309982.1 hypothetical protein [Nocardioides luteus]GGR59187.1 hypothetical protein GCM10010197_27430 [Nocardioides luteus]GLJ67109.1 hypothetical protein GCM10017579_11450 [Nocardioides luteus]
MESLALTFSSGWASGINAYLVVLVLGVVQRTTGAEEIPDVLGTWPVLAAAGLLFLVEFVADKVPYIDSTWDSISTVIRPTIGAVIGILIAGEADSLNEAVGAVVGGTSALMSHLVKASERLAVNASPEPVSNSAVSLAEDGLVLFVVWFATAHPLIAAGIAAVLLVAGLVVAYLILRAIRGGWRRLTRRGRRGSPPPDGPSDGSTKPYPVQ